MSDNFAFSDAPIFDGLNEEEIAPDPSASKAPPQAVKKIGGLLGDNKKRGGPRALTKADGDKIAGFYATMGMAIAPFRPDLGRAFVTQASDAADAWLAVAKENDSIRRGILWAVEGGAWGMLIMVHLPIIAAAVPADKLPAFLIQPSSDDQESEGFQFPRFQPE